MSPGVVELEGVESDRAALPQAEVAQVQITVAAANKPAAGPPREPCPPA